MQGMKFKKYMHVTRKRFDPFAVFMGTAGLSGVMLFSLGEAGRQGLFDPRGFAIVVVGTLASLLFQFDFITLGQSIWLTVRSFFGTPERDIERVMQELDRAILTKVRFESLRKGDGINGEYLNDVIFMVRQGLSFDEIDAFVTSRVRDEYLARDIAANVLQKASILAPALGLFGTVLGLIEVLRALNNPQSLGPAMSLALLTTAYGAGLGAVVFSPLVGRLEHHNHIFLEVHEQLLSKISILMRRSEREAKGRDQSEVLAA